MNREIKFRVWNSEDKTWDNPAILEVWDESGKLEPYSYIKTGKLNPLYQPVENYIIQQWTGLLDKSGKEIYEGDIITFTKRGITHGPDAEDVKNAEVWYSFEDCSFVFGKYKSADYTWWYSMVDDLRDFEVVGNIFENHNLLDNTIKI